MFSVIVFICTAALFTSNVIQGLPSFKCDLVSSAPRVLETRRKIRLVVNSSGFAQFQLKMSNINENTSGLSAKVYGMSFWASLNESSLNGWTQTIVFRAKLSQSAQSFLPKDGPVGEQPDLRITLKTFNGTRSSVSVPDSIRFEIWGEEELQQHRQSLLLMGLAGAAGIILLAMTAVVVVFTALRRRNSRLEELKAVQRVERQATVYEPIRISRDVYGRGSIVVPAEK